MLVATTTRSASRAPVSVVRWTGSEPRTLVTRACSNSCTPCAAAWSDSASSSSHRVDLQLVGEPNRAAGRERQRELVGPRRPRARRAVATSSSRATSRSPCGAVGVADRVPTLHGHVVVLAEPLQPGQALTLRLDVLPDHGGRSACRAIVESRVPCRQLIFAVLRPVVTAPTCSASSTRDRPAGPGQQQRGREAGQPGADHGDVESSLHGRPAARRAGRGSCPARATAASCQSFRFACARCRSSRPRRTSFRSLRRRLLQLPVITRRQLDLLLGRDA